MTFNADIGNVNPSVVTLSNNVGESTYSSNAVGEETVRIFVGNVEVSNIKFNVHASVINRIYVSVSGSDSNIGTIDNPLRKSIVALFITSLSFVKVKILLV